MRCQSKMFGPLESMASPADVEASWKSVESTLKQVAAVLSAEKGAFLTGEEPIYADFILLAVFQWISLVRPEEFERVLGVAPEIRKYWGASEPWR